jgi:hypothetical protein
MFQLEFSLLRFPEWERDDASRLFVSFENGRSCCDAASGIEERMIGKAGFALPIVALRSN